MHPVHPGNRCIRQRHYAWRSDYFAGNYRPWASFGRVIRCDGPASEGEKGLRANKLHPHGLPKTVPLKAKDLSNISIKEYETSCTFIGIRKVWIDQKNLRFLNQYWFYILCVQMLYDRLMHRSIARHISAFVSWITFIVSKDSAIHVRESAASLR